MNDILNSQIDSLKINDFLNTAQKFTRRSYSRFKYNRII